MASGGGGRRPGGADTPWWVTGIKVVAGIGAVALGAYAAARAAEEALREEEPMTSTQSAASCSDDKACKSDSSDSDNNADDDDQWVDINDDDEYSDSSDDVRQSSAGERPLVELLEEYYQDKVQAPDEEITAMKAVAEQVAQNITEYVRGRHANILQRDVFVAGSAYDGTTVKHPNMFVLLVPLNLEANMWKIVNAKDTVLKAPGYALVHRANTDFYRPGSSIWDRFLVGTYLNSDLIQRLLEDVLNKVTNRGFTFAYQDYYVTSIDKALTLELIHPVGGLVDHMTLQVVPCITLEGPNGTVCLEGIPHGCLSESAERRARKADTYERDPYENLWYQSTRTKEAEMLQDEDGGCRKKCLQILKAVCRNQPPLSSLSEFHVKTVCLHLCEEESEWEDVMMAERFLDVLKTLEQFLDDKKLPHVVHKEMDLFEGFASRQLGKMNTWLQKRLKQPNGVHALLI
ncbi:mitochondrial dynamics protein MID51-like isoform X2 [Amphiura filiformis]|uniref:mitochondrial dynamics protein MID51-like isoform X2 n=1 Tax=Amphiura filiformis TaxID=82378 RepID=UPI003B213498